MQIHFSDTNVVITVANSGDEVCLRPAVKTDAVAIRRLVRGEQLNPLGLRWQRFMVMTAETEVIACAQLKLHRGDVREFASLVVAEPWRGRGLAGRLINHFLQASSQPLWLMCGSQLVPFYERFGFAQVREGAGLPGYFRPIFYLSRLFARGEKTLAIMRTV